MLSFQRASGFPSASAPFGRVRCHSVIVIIYLLGGFSGRFGGYYGMGHSGMGLGSVVLVILIVLLLLGKL